MGESEKIRIAKIAIRKNLDYEQLKYGDDLYGKEYETEAVWEYVTECREIGEIEFQKKYGSI